MRKRMSDLGHPHRCVLKMGPGIDMLACCPKNVDCMSDISQWKVSSQVSGNHVLQIVHIQAGNLRFGGR